MKMKRPNTPDIPVTNMDMTDLDKMKAPLSAEVCDRFGLMCQFCKQSIPHPLPKELDWTDKDWTGEQIKTQKPVGEINLSPQF